MQSLYETSKLEGVAGCAREVLDAAPILVSYIRLHMRKQRKGLSVPQFRALVKVRKQPGLSLSEVADHLGASLPTTSRLVAKLVAKGFLARRESDTDRRQVMLEITPAGRALVDAATASTQAQMEAELTNLTETQREHVRRGMGILKEILWAAGPCAGQRADARTNGTARPDGRGGGKRQTPS